MIKRSRYPILVLGLFGLTVMAIKPRASAKADEPAKLPGPNSTIYKTSEIEGWTVYVKRDFLKSQPELAERTLTLLRLQLFQIARIVPAAAVKKLRTVPIWVEENDPSTPCMAYHPGADWCVSITRTRPWPAVSSWRMPANFSTGPSSSRG